MKTARGPGRKRPAGGGEHKEAAEGYRSRRREGVLVERKLRGEEVEQKEGALIYLVSSVLLVVSCSCNRFYVSCSVNGYLLMGLMFFQWGDHVSFN